MSRSLLIVVPLAMAGLIFASPAGAAPCEDGMSSVEYAIDLASGAMPTSEEPSEIPPMCVENCNRECDDTNSATEWDACYYPCIKGCLDWPS